MPDIGQIREYVATKLLTLGTTAYDFDSDRIHLGHVTRPNDSDYSALLYEEGPQVVIQPGEITSYNVQRRLGTAKVILLLDFGVDPQSDLNFSDIEQFVLAIVYGLADLSNTYVPQNIIAERPKFDQERTNLIEYKITLDGWLIC